MRRLFLLIACIFMLSCGDQSLEESHLGEPPPKVEEVSQTEPTAPLDDLLDRTETVNVYFRHPMIEGVTPLERKIFKHHNVADEIKQVIDQLTIPPASEDGIAIWPENTYIRELYLLESGTVVIDFDSGFVDSIGAGATTEAFMVYSLVNTILDNFPDYQEVRLLVDGTVRETFLGHIDIEFPLKRGHLYTIVPEVHLEDEIIEEELPPPPLKNEDLN